jgi:hypothetical protein
VNWTQENYVQSVITVRDMLEDELAVADTIDTMPDEQFLAVVRAVNARLEREEYGCLNLQ